MHIVLGSPLDYCNEWYFEEYCKFHLQYCKKLIIFYDDFKRKPLQETLEIASKYNVDFNYIGEEFYETRVWKKVLEKCLTYKSDWVGLLAVDSILSDKFLNSTNELFNSDAQWYGFPIFNFWEDYSHYRIDGVWGAGRNVCLHTFLKVTSLNIDEYSFGDKKIHGSHFPDNLKSKNGCWIKYNPIVSDRESIIIKHMGYVKKDAWKERCIARGNDYGRIDEQFGDVVLQKWEE